MPKIRDALHRVDPYEGFVPVPHRYGLGHSPGGGDSSLFRRLVEQIRPSVIVELGTWYGGSAITMAMAVKELGLDCEIVCIDTWLTGNVMWRGGAHECLALRNGYPQAYYFFLSNVMEYGVRDYITPLPLMSIHGVAALKELDVEASLIYVDAEHTEESAYEDITISQPLLASGGTIFGDDYYNSSSGVGRAVGHAFGNNFWTYDWVGVPEELQKNRFWVHGPILEEEQTSE